MINTAVIRRALSFYFPHAETKDSMIKSKRHNDEKKEKNICSAPVRRETDQSLCRFLYGTIWEWLLFKVRYKMVTGEAEERLSGVPCCKVPGKAGKHRLGRS